MKFALRLLAVCFVLGCAVPPLESAEPKRVLLIGQGPDGHPPKTHEFMAGTRVLQALLKDVDGLNVSVVNASEPWPDGPDLISKADGVVIFVSEGAKWAQSDARRWEALTKLAARGGGVVALHWGIGAKDPKYIAGYRQFIGGVHGGPDRKYSVLETNVKPAGDHPIARGIEPFRARDEYYHHLKFVQPEGTIDPVLTAAIDGEDHTVAWAWKRPDGGRSFGFSGLHFHENWEKNPYRRLVAQAVLWTNGLEVPNDGLKVEIDAEVLKLEPAK